jgi:selenocysteine-specific elongation factor
VERAEAGQRVAVALPRVAPGELLRGTALVAPGAYEVTHRLDIVPEELESVPARVTVHHGSAEAHARLRRRDGLVQLRLASPFVAAPGDRVLLRAGTTVGGGLVVERRNATRVEEPRAVRSAPPPPAPEDGRVRLPGGFALDETELARARELVVGECEREGTITLARARDLLGTSRRAAQAILERLDNDRVTLRIGDSRRLRRR